MIALSLADSFSKPRRNRDKQQRKKDDSDQTVIMVIYVVLVIISLLIQVFSVQTAAYCNPQNKLFFGLLAILFPDIYLIQFVVRKYMLKTPGYCGNEILVNGVVDQSFNAQQ